MWQGQFELDGRSVVITGGATGIDFALARQLGGRGCRILIAEPGEDRLRSAVDELRGLGIDATFHLCDVTELSQVERLADAAWKPGAWTWYSTVQQIADGRFYIVSHAYNMVHIQERYDEISRAYATYAPRYEGDEEFDVRHLLSSRR